MSEVSEYKCLDCGSVSQTYESGNCANCNSSNIEPAKSNGSVKTILIIFVVVVLLFLTGVLSITTNGCTLPIDLVLGDICLFGSFGASLGATIAMAVLMAVFAGLWKLITLFFK